MKTEVMSMLQQVHWTSYIFSGFAATLLLTTSLALCRGQGLTRMDFSLLLGSIFTYNRERAKVYGFLMHFFIGWMFSFLYIFAFMLTGHSLLWFGPMLGMIHAIFLLSVGMWILPAFHPRMANEEFGPEPTRQLEPPGYLALNYGRSTPISVLVSHMIYGGILGMLYR